MNSSDEAARLRREAALFNLAMGGDGDVGVVRDLPPVTLVDSDLESLGSEVDSDEEEDVDEYTANYQDEEVIPNKHVRVEVNGRANRFFSLPGYEMEVAVSKQDVQGTGLLTNHEGLASGLRQFFRPSGVDAQKAAAIAALQKNVLPLPITKGKGRGRKKKTIEKHIRTSINLYNGAQDNATHVAVVLSDEKLCGAVSATVSADGLTTLHRTQYYVNKDRLSNPTTLSSSLNNHVLVEVDSNNHDTYTLPKGTSLTHLTSTVSNTLFVVGGQLMAWEWNWGGHGSGDPVPHPRTKELGLLKRNIVSVESSRLRTFLWCEDGTLCTFVDPRVRDMLLIQVNGDANALHGMLRRLEFPCTSFLTLKHAIVQSISCSDDTLCVVTKKGRVVFWHLVEVGEQGSEGGEKGGGDETDTNTGGGLSGGLSGFTGGAAALMFKKGQYVASKVSLGGAIVMMRSHKKKTGCDIGALGYPQVGQVITNDNGYLTVKSYPNDELRQHALSSSSRSSSSRSSSSRSSSSPKRRRSLSTSRHHPVGVPTLPVPDLIPSAA